MGKKWPLNRARTAYLEMGSPSSLDAGQLERLQALTADVPEIDRHVRVSDDGQLSLELPCAAMMWS